MRKVVSLSLTVIAASLLLAAAVGTASARNLSSSSSDWRVTWAGLEFVSPGLLTIRCRVTLLGTFHARTIAKVARSLIGSVTRAFVTRPCTNGEGWAFDGTEGRPQTLPWHLTYEAFAGTLPNITSLDVLLSRFRFLISSGFCGAASYGSATDNVTGRITRNTATGELTTLAPVAGRNTVNRVTLLSGFCPATGLMAGTGNVMTESGARITVTLI